VSGNIVNGNRIILEKFVRFVLALLFFINFYANVKAKPATVYIRPEAEFVGEEKYCFLEGRVDISEMTTQDIELYLGKQKALIRDNKYLFDSVKYDTKDGAKYKLYAKLKIEDAYIDFEISPAKISLDPKHAEHLIIKDGKYVFKQDLVIKAITISQLSGNIRFSLGSEFKVDESYTREANKAISKINFENKNTYEKYNCKVRNGKFSLRLPAGAYTVSEVKIEDEAKLKRPCPLKSVYPQDIRINKGENQINFKIQPSNSFSKIAVIFPEKYYGKIDKIDWKNTYRELDWVRTQIKATLLRWPKKDVLSSWDDFDKLLFDTKDKVTVNPYLYKNKNYPSKIQYSNAEFVWDDVPFGIYFLEVIIDEKLTNQYGLPVFGENSGELYNEYITRKKIVILPMKDQAIIINPQKKEPLFITTSCFSTIKEKLVEKGELTKEGEIKEKIFDYDHDYLGRVEKLGEPLVGKITVVEWKRRKKSLYPIDWKKSLTVELEGKEYQIEIGIKTNYFDVVQKYTPRLTPYDNRPIVEWYWMVNEKRRDFKIAAADFGSIKIGHYSAPEYWEGYDEGEWKNKVIQDKIYPFEIAFDSEIYFKRGKTERGLFQVPEVRTEATASDFSFKLYQYKTERPPIKKLLIKDYFNKILTE